MPGSTADAKRTALPFVGADQRLRWDLQELYDALDSQRRERSFTWPQLAHELHCSPSQLSGIKRPRFAIGMRLAMRIVTFRILSAMLRQGFHSFHEDLSPEHCG